MTTAPDISDEVLLSVIACLGWSHIRHLVCADVFLLSKHAKALRNEDTELGFKKAN